MLFRSIAVTIGGNWYGLFGMIIAVPITASLKTLISDWYVHYMKDSYDNYKENDDILKNNDGKIFSELKKAKEEAAPKEDEE